MNKSTFRLGMVALVIIPFTLGLALGVYGFSDPATNTQGEPESASLIDTALDDVKLVKRVGLQDKSGAPCGAHLITVSGNSGIFVRANLSQSGLSEEAMKGAQAVKSYIDDGKAETLNAGLTEALYHTFACGLDEWPATTLRTQDQNGSSAFTGEGFDGPKELTGRTALILHDYDGEQRLQEVTFAKNYQYLYMYSEPHDLEYQLLTKPCGSITDVTEQTLGAYKACGKSVMEKAADNWLLQGDLGNFGLHFTVVE